MHALATGVLGDSKNGRCLGMAVIENLVQQERGALIGPHGVRAAGTGTDRCGSPRL